MLELSRDWRESMTLSSRDPHLGQRMVFGDYLPHHLLWSQNYLRNVFSCGQTVVLREAPTVAYNCSASGPDGAIFPVRSPDAVRQRLPRSEHAWSRLFSRAASSRRTGSRSCHSPTS